MMTFEIQADRLDSSGSRVFTRQAELVIATGMTVRADALNPVELLLAALAACMIKGIERVAETLGVDYDTVHIRLVARRPEDEARIEDVRYEVSLKTSADQGRLDLLHKNLRKFGTIYNTISAGTSLEGTLCASPD
jgi:uncharacterized OsmC-like protein